jgi:hypothetical protein
VDCVLLVRVGIPSLKKEWKLFLARQAWSYCFWFLVCGPFVAQGAKGEEEYPSIGWEVPMKSQVWRRFERGAKSKEEFIHSYVHLESLRESIEEMMVAMVEEILGTPFHGGSQEA